MRKIKQKLYMDEKGGLWILLDRIKANTHDTIYCWESCDFNPYFKEPTVHKMEVMISPKACGFTCLGVL